MRKVHFLKWEKVVRPKHKGGLYIIPTREANTAQLAKAGWQLCDNSEKLWTNVFKAKYLKNVDMMHCENKATDSVVWKGILRRFYEVKEGFKWNVKNGRSISFWYD